MAEFELNLLSLSGKSGLTAAKGAALAEAAAVCLDSQSHVSPTFLIARCQHSPEGKNESEKRFELHWPAVTDVMRRSSGDLREAVEDGACAIAIALIGALAGLPVVERSWIGTGFDYWIGEDDAFPFDRKARLEVSGILAARRRSEVSSRLRQKLQQTQRSDTTELPAYVVIVEFSTPEGRVAKR